MTSTDDQIKAIASTEGLSAVIQKYGLDGEEAVNTFAEVYGGVIAHAAEGDGKCLRIGCEQQVSPMSSIVCSDHLTEISA